MAIPTRSRRRTRVSDAHGTSRGCPRHISSRSSPLHAPWRAGRFRELSGGDGQAVPGVDGGHGQSQVGQFFIGEVRADFFVNLVGNVAVGDARDGFRLLLLNQARAARLRRIIRKRMIPLRSGCHNLEKIGRRGWKPRAIKAKSKRRTRVSDPHVTSRGRGRPRHIFIMRSSSLLGSWVRAGRFPAPCAEAMARRVVLVEADRGCARGFDKVLGSQHGGSLNARSKAIPSCGWWRTWLIPAGWRRRACRRCC